MEIPYTIERVFDAPLEKAWQALTRPEKMKKWYFALIERFEPVVGYEFQFGTDGSPYVKEWKVTGVVELKKLSHSWAYKGFDGISEVTFELFPEGNKTRLKVTQTGLNTFPDNPHFARPNWESGWERIIGSNLKTFLES